MAEDRGLATALFVFLAIIVVSALLFTLMNPAVNQVTDRVSSQADHQEARDVIDERRQIWSYVLFYPMFLAALYIIARAVLESREPG